MSSNFSNSYLKIGVIAEPPYADDCYFQKNYNNDCLYRPGYGIELANLVCEILNFTCIIEKVNHTLYGSLTENGTWIGMVQQVMDSEFNTSVPQLTATKQRQKVLDFTSPFVTHSTILATRPASAHDAPISTIFVFSPEVWALIFATAVVVASFASTTVVFHPKTPKKRLKTYTETVIESASVFSGQSVSESRILTTSARLAVGIWCLMTVVLVGTYSAYILASLIARTVAPPFSDLSSLADCLQRGECRLVHTSRSVAPLTTLFETETEFLSAEMIKMRDALGSIDAVQVFDRKILAKKLLSDNSRFNVLWMPMLKFSAMAEENEFCKYFLIKVGQLQDSFPFAKKSPLIQPFYEAQEKILASGLFKRIMDKYGSRSCHSMGQQAQPLAFEPFLGTIFLLSVGSGIGILILVLENVWRRKGKLSQLCSSGR